jgi:hypothetical protein
VLRVLPVLPALLVRPDLKVPLAHKDQKATRELLGLLGPQV